MTNTIAKEWMDAILTGIPKQMPELEETMKKSASLNQKLSETAFHAAEESIKLSAEWTKETLANVEKLAKTQNDPADWVNILSHLASNSAGQSTQKMNALAEIMGRMQAETLRLFVEAGQDMNGEQVKAPTSKNKVKPKAKSSPAATGNV